METASLMEFVSLHPLLSGAAVIIVVLLIGNEIALRTRGYRTVAPAALVRMMNQDNAVVVDVRDKPDYRKGHISGARNLPLTQLNENPAQAGDKDQSVVTCCESGAESARAASALVKAGFKQVHTLQGGLVSWRQDNLPLNKK